MVSAYQNGSRTANVCEKYGISDTGLRNVLRLHGVALNQASRLNVVQKERARELYESGQSIRQVSSSLGLSENGAFRAIRASDAIMRPRVKRHILSGVQKLELVKLYNERSTFEDLCSLFGVSSSVVSRVLKDSGVETRTGWARYRTVEWSDRHGRIHVFKSSWELAYARHIDSTGIEWAYEPRKFRLVKCRCYTPDFGIYENGKLTKLVEVKGWIDERTIDRLNEVHVSYPSLVIEFVGPKELASLGLIDAKYARHPMADIIFRIQQKFSST